MTILVTGFEPFGAFDHNPSTDIAMALAGVPGFSTTVLPVSYATMPLRLRAAIDATDNLSLVISCGLANRRRKVCVEVKAVNKKFAAIPDNDGVRADGELLFSSPASLRVDAGIAERVYSALSGAGLPVRYSTDAGTYLCNATLFHLLAWGVPSVFVHVPSARLVDPRQIAGALSALAHEV